MFINEKLLLLTEVLGHRIGFKRERVKLVGIDSELLLDRSQRLVVNKEEDLP